MNTTLKLSIGLVSLCFLGNAIANGSCTNENTAIPFSTPSSDFTLDNNGTVTSKTTGLMWMRCSMGQTWQGESCTGVASDFTWQQALTQNGTEYAGYNDWRVPNKNELASIVEQRCNNPSINGAIFPNTPDSRFRSSSPIVGSSDHAWDVDFGGYGYVTSYYKNDYGHVRLVRATKAQLKEIETTYTFSDVQSLENDWVLEHRQGCCGIGNIYSYEINDKSLKLTVAGSSDGFMGIYDGGQLYLKELAINDDFAVEIRISEIYRSRNDNYKDNSGISLTLEDLSGNHYASIGIRGNYSGYFQDHNYDEYRGHRIQANIKGNNKFVMLDELTIDQNYDVTFKIERTGNNLTTAYKLDGSGNWITQNREVDLSNELALRPVISISSGDGGRTRVNGNFVANVHFLKVTRKQP